MIIVVQFILAACAAHVQFLPYNFYRISLEVPPPRYKGMKPDQEWTDVWPAAHSFKWSVVPLPIRQGYVEVRPCFLLSLKIFGLYDESRITDCWRLQIIIIFASLIATFVPCLCTAVGEWEHPSGQVRQCRTDEDSELSSPDAEPRQKAVCRHQTSVFLGFSIWQLYYTNFCVIRKLWVYFAGCLIVLLL